MRVSTLLLSSLALLAGSMTVAAPIAQADTQGCVTRTEWRRVYIVPDGTGSGPGQGGTMKRIHRIFDTRGQRVHYIPRSHGQRWQTRAYKKCNKHGRYKVEYLQYKQRRWQSYWG